MSNGIKVREQITRTSVPLRPRSGGMSAPGASRTFPDDRSSAASRGEADINRCDSRRWNL